jgi:hypothetical protein
MTRTVTLSALLVALTLPTLAQVPGAGASTEEARDVERPRKRLLHLAGGGVIRASAREVDGRWEIKRGREWVALPPGGVTRVALERDVLAESRKLAAKLSRDDHERRVEYARWLAGEGLLEESLGELDRVLAAECDHAGALSFLAERPVRPALPSAADERPDFLVRASRLSPAGRELALGLLDEACGGGAEERDELREALGLELGAITSTRRGFAALALRRMFPGEEIPRLSRRAVLDPVSSVREEAGLALRDATNPEVAVPVISALTSSHPIVRKHAADALGVMGYAVAVEPLVATLQSSSGYRPAASHIFVGSQQAYVQDYDVEVAQGASIAKPNINVLTQGSVLDARVLSASQGSVAAERTSIRRALERITGADVGRSRNAWQRWWDENGADFRRENELVPPGGSVTSTATE